MNITANTVASKLFVAFVAAAMLFTLVTPAKAATTEELQAQITALMAQIAALKGDAPAAAASSAACTFTRSLTVGSEGADVKCLQDYLTPKYFTNAGGSTGYFGSVTAAAVAAWQGANGVAPAVGYFGPLSQAKYSAMMAATPTTPDTDDSDNTDDNTSSTDLSGEASLKDMSIDSASDDTIEESSADQEIGVATLEFQDGDAMITRIDVRLTGVEKVWNIYDEVALFVDGDEIARMDASSKSDYLNTVGATGTLRFSGLDLVAMEDEEVEVSIVASVGSVDSGDLGTYSVAVDSLRFVDGTDVTSTLGSIDDADFTSAVTFTIGVSGGDDELIVKTSSNDPDSTTLEVKDDAKSDWYTVFEFDLDTDDSTNDIELTSVPLIIDVASSTNSLAALTYAGIVDDVKLVIDGVTVNTLTVSGGAATTTAVGYDASHVLTFDVDGDVTIDAGDRVSAELMVRFKSLASTNEGATVRARVSSENSKAIDALGADDLATSQLSGAATGDAHTLRTMGVIGEAVSMSSVLNAGVSGGNDTVNYTMKIDVTAFNQDVYIAKNSGTSVRYEMTDSSGTGIGATTTTSVDSFTSTADDDGTYFYVPEGSTKTFTIVVKWAPGAVNTAKGVQLSGLDYAATAAPETNAWSAVPAKNYRTDAKSTNL